jgi:hypothetical protein
MLCKHCTVMFKSQYDEQHICASIEDLIQATQDGCYICCNVMIIYKTRI